MTAAQKQHAREQRALLYLRRCAVRLTLHVDAAAGDNAGDFLAVEAMLLHELECAAHKYCRALAPRERRRLVR
jgi:hypothetical protein